MNLKKLTAMFIVGVIAVVSIFDVFVYMQGGTEVTISYTIFRWSHEYPSVTFAAGYLCGHLFWRIKPVKKDEADQSEIKA